MSHVAKRTTSQKSGRRNSCVSWTGRAGQLMVQYMEKAERMDTLMCEKEGDGRIRRQLD